VEIAPDPATLVAIDRHPCATVLRWRLVQDGAVGLAVPPRGRLPVGKTQRRVSHRVGDGVSPSLGRRPERELGEQSPECAAREQVGLQQRGEEAEREDDARGARSR
jgi:hypothetical protein